MAKKQKFPLKVFLFVLLLYPKVLLSEIRQCGSLWTSKLCDELEAVSNESETSLDPIQNEKESILADLERFANKVEAELGRKDFEASGARDFCLKPQISVEECRARALRADKALMSSLQMFARIRQRQVELNQKQQEIFLRRERLHQETRKRNK